MLGEVIKTPALHFSALLHGGGITLPPVAVSVSEQPRAGFISAEKRLSQSGCSAPTNALFPPAHSAFLAPLCGGWYHYPRRAFHAAKTLGAQGARWLNSSLPRTLSPSALRAHTGAYTGKHGGVSPSP